MEKGAEAQQVQCHQVLVPDDGDDAGDAVDDGVEMCAVGAKLQGKSKE